MGDGNGNAVRTTRGPGGWRVATFGLALCAGLGGFAMTGERATGASQRPYPVVALRCDADLRLCQALVRALSEKTPTHLYRLNPRPVPPQAFALALDVDTAGAARLRWADGAGTAVDRGGHNDAEFARHIVDNASPALAEALKGSR